MDKPTEDDDSVQELLLKSFLLTIERFLIDHYLVESSSVNDPAVISETLLVPKTNVFPERDFAILDRMLQFWLDVKAWFTELQ